MIKVGAPIEASGFANVGLVSSAVHGPRRGRLAELVLACEWGPLRIFRNERGTFNLGTPSDG